jgi:lysophospholipase L1-like esterase
MAPPRTFADTPTGVVTTRALVGALLGAAVLGAEALHAGHRSYLGAGNAPPGETTCGDPADPNLRLVLIGDSTAAGVGAGDAAGTVGAQLGALLATLERRRVEVSTVAVSGSRAGDLGPQVSRALLTKPGIAVILIGANDALHLTALASVRAAVTEAIRRLVSAGVPSVVGSCPDLGAVTAFLQPLRSLAAWQGRRVGVATREGARAGGGEPVDLAAMTGAAFRHDPATLLGSDQFHPSSAGYGVLATALLPATRRLVSVAVSS